MKRKVLLLCLLLGCIGGLLTACGRGSSATEIRLGSDGARVSGPAKASVRTTADSVTITRAGNYHITGAAKMQLIVEVESGKAVYLTLDGIDLTCDSSAPLYVKKASMVVLNLATGSQNTITDRHLYTEIVEQNDSVQTTSDTLTENPSAAIYSRSPLLIQGEGKLTVNAESYNGISTNDTFTMKSGNLTVSSVMHGIKGKDYVVISGGNLILRCEEGDGIKATNTERPELGYLNITGGNVTINCGDEGLYAPSSISISGGNLSIKSKKTALLTSGTLNLSGGIIELRTNNPPLSAAQKTVSPSVLITVNGRPYAQQ